MYIYIFFFNQLVTFECVTDLGMDDEGDDDPVPLPNVNAAILKKVGGPEMQLASNTCFHCQR